MPQAADGDGPTVAQRPEGTGSLDLRLSITSTLSFPIIHGGIILKWTAFFRLAVRATY